jgi:hypothetical protein
MQSTCGAYELIFWRRADDGFTQEPSATKMRDVCWSTWTSSLGWPVQGIWPPVGRQHCSRHEPDEAPDLN